jgi:hypothetical protein
LSAEEFEEKLSMMKPLDLRLKVGTLTAISGSVVFEAGGCTVAAECNIVEADSAVPVDAQDVPLLLNVIVSLRNNAKMEIRQVSSAPDEPRR